MKVLSGQTAQTVTESGAGSGDRSLQEKNLSFTLELVCGRPKRQGCRVARAGSPASASRRGTIRIDIEAMSEETNANNEFA